MDAEEEGGKDLLSQPGQRPPQQLLENTSLCRPSAYPYKHIVKTVQNEVELTKKPGHGSAKRNENKTLKSTKDTMKLWEK